MKCQVYLHNNTQNSSHWTDDGHSISFNEITPTSKVISILEVCGATKLAALSCHYDHLAVINRGKGDTEFLHLLNLKTKKVTLLKSFPQPVTVIYFASECEHSLFVGSLCGRIFSFEIKTETVKILEGHANFPRGIYCHHNSKHLITWSSTEVLLWSWPHCQLQKRLKINPNFVVVESGFVVNKNYIFVCFHSGLILLWDLSLGMREFPIKLPDGVIMDFESFSISADGDWIVGIGSQALIVIYSLTTQKVAQVVHLSHPESLLSISQVQCLPPVHPQFPKTYLLRTTSCIFVVDFISSAVVKVLKSDRYSVRDVCISADGFLICVIYGNGNAKLYTLPSFFPNANTFMHVAHKPLEDIPFTVLTTPEQNQRKKPVELLLDETKWIEILEEFGEFPTKYRKHIWVSLSKLPRNFSVFSLILQKKKTKAFETLDEKFSSLGDKVLEVLKSVLECLCYWSPFLTCVETLPNFILPFVQYFEPNALLCFEMTSFVILNWCSLWFKNWPSPPQRLLNIVEEMVSTSDAFLWLHLKTINLTPRHYAWPLLTSAFNQVFTREDWLVIWDHLLSKPPSFILCVCAAFTLSLKHTLLKCSKELHAKQLFFQETWVPARTIIKRAKHLSSLKLKEEIPKELKEKRFLIKNALMPFDIGPESADAVKACHSAMTQSYFDNEETLRVTKELSGTLKDLNLASGSSYTSVPKCSADLVDLDSLDRYDGNFEMLSEREDECLRKIQRTRKKQIGLI